MTTPSFINSNLTGALLSGIAEIHYDFFGSKHDRKPEKLKKKNALSDEVLIKGKTSHSSQTISFFNESGIDIIIYPTRCVESIGRKSKQELDKINSTYHLIKDGDRTTEKYSNFEYLLSTHQPISNHHQEALLHLVPFLEHTSNPSILLHLLSSEVSSSLNIST